MSKKLVKVSFGVTIVMLIGSLLSFVKEAMIANYYGVSAEVDAYTIAIQIPVMLFSFISVAVQSVVIPVFSDIWYNKSEQEASKYLDNLITVLFIATAAMCVLGITLAEPIVYLFAPGFQTRTHALAVELLRITFPSIIFSVICHVMVAVLNVYKKFVLNSVAIYFTNITIILCIVFLHGKYGIVAACGGQLVGDGLKCGFVVLLARRFYKYRFGFNFKHPEVLKTMKQSVPVLWSMSVAEINAIVNRIVGSFLFTGAIAALSYSGKISSFMMQLFVSAIATIVYPLYAESAAKNDISQLGNRINSTISAYSLFIFPLSLGVIIFREEVIDLVFGRGAFNLEAIAQTKELLGIYAAGMLFMAFRATLTNVFYSMNDTKTPAVNASIGAALNIVLNLSLPFVLGINGLALSTTITAIYVTSSLMWQMIKKYKEINMKVFFSNLKGIVISGMMMLAFILVFHHLADSWSPIMTFTVGTAIGIVVYLMCVLILKVPVAKQIVTMLISKSN